MPPYEMMQTEHGYGVKNMKTGMMKSKDISEEKAKRQMRLLMDVEHKLKLNKE